MNASMCPKCGGGAYLAEEELIKILEGTNPLKVLLRAHFVCRACAEKFNRIIYDDLANRKHNPQAAAPFQVYQPPAQTASAPAQQDSVAESLRFF
jgi:Zn-finger nucleic acid-binding protein